MDCRCTSQLFMSKPMLFAKKVSIYSKSIYNCCQKTSLCQLGGPVNLHHTSVSISFSLEAHRFDVSLVRIDLVSPADSQRVVFQTQTQFKKRTNVLKQQY